MRKLLAAATTSIVAMAIVLAGAGSPALADTSTGSGSPTSTSTPAPAASPTPSASPTPTAHPTPSATPSATPSPTPSPQTLPCIADYRVSYTYDSKTNSGVITVPTDSKSSGVLCQSFYVTATSWKYTQAALWPQTRDVVDKLAKISASGTYQYAAAVTCGQGDIYASYDSSPAPTSTLTAPGVPFPEHFLSDMNFQGVSPTYMQQNIGCFTPTAVTAKATSTNATCAAPTANSVTLPAVAGGVWSWSTKGASGSYAVGQGYTGSQQAGYGEYTYTLSDGDSGDTYSVTSYTTTWTPTDASGLDCNIQTIPGDPSVTNQTCGDEGLIGGTITVVEKPGLVYTVTSADGTTTYPIVDGVASDLPVGHYIVSVVATSGYELSGDSQWPVTLVVNPPYDECLPTLPVWDSGVSAAPATCTPDGAEGTITLVHAEDQAGKVDYSIASAPTPAVAHTFRLFAAAAAPTGTDLGTTATSVIEAPGTYIVTASPAVPGDGMNDANLPSNAVVQDDGTIQYTVTIDAPAVGDCGQLTTDAAYTADATVAADTCQASDGTSAAINLFTTPGLVNYSITNLATNTTTSLGSNTASVNEPAGDYTVTARVVNASDTILGFNQPDGSLTIPITVLAVAADCSTVSTLAFTGSDPSLPLVIAGILLLLGAATVFGRRWFARAN
jgi:hypothetical protein